MAKTPTLVPFSVTLPNGQRVRAAEGVTATELKARTKALHEALSGLELEPVGHTATELSAVREWAQTAGVTVGKRGRISAEVFDQYREAQKAARSKSSKPKTPKPATAPATVETPSED